MGDLGHRLHHVRVVLDVDTVGHHHLGDGGGGVDVLCGDGDLYVGPWKDYYHPTKIGRRLVVCPTWEEYTVGEGEVVLRLDPGMAFPPPAPP